MELTTARLLMRPWEESDAERLYELVKDPDIGLNAGWMPHTDVENSREIIRQVLAGEGTFAVCLRDSGLVVGCVGWKETNADDSLDELELGYWMGRDYWGRGYMPEAARAILGRCFGPLAQSRVWCAHYEGNDKSRRVIEKCGFQFMFDKIDDVVLLNERRRCYYYAITAEEWENQL